MKEEEDQDPDTLTGQMYQHLLNAVCLLIAVTLKDKNDIKIDDLNSTIEDEFCKIRDWVTQE